MQQPDKSLKILIIGDNGVGKTSVILRFTDNVFNQDEPTVLVDCKVKSVDVGGKLYKLQIWDTFGQEKVAQLTSSFYKGAQGLIIVYDSSNRESFEKITSKWSIEAKRYVSSNTPILIVGCKSDLEKKTPPEMVRNFCSENKFIGIECSALRNENIDLIFLTITKMIITPHQFGLAPISSNTTTLAASTSSITSSSSNNRSSRNREHSGSFSNSLSNSTNSNNNNSSNNKDPKKKDKGIFKSFFSSSSNSNSNNNSGGSGVSSPSLQPLNSSNSNILTGSSNHYIYNGNNSNNNNNLSGGTVNNRDQLLGSNGISNINQDSNNNTGVNNNLTSSVNSVSSTTSSGSNLLTSSNSSVNNNNNNINNNNNNIDNTGGNNNNNKNDNGGTVKKKGVFKNLKSSGDKEKDKEKEKEQKEKDAKGVTSPKNNNSNNNNNNINNSNNSNNNSNNVSNLNQSTIGNSIVSVIGFNSNNNNNNNMSNILNNNGGGSANNSGTNLLKESGLIGNIAINSNTPAETEENFKLRRYQILSVPFPAQPPFKDANGRLNYYQVCSTEVANSLHNPTTSNTSFISPVLEPNTTANTTTNSSNNNTINQPQNQQPFSLNNGNANSNILTQSSNINHLNTFVAALNLQQLQAQAQQLAQQQAQAQAYQHQLVQQQKLEQQLLQQQQYQQYQQFQNYGNNSPNTIPTIITTSVQPKNSSPEIDYDNAYNEAYGFHPSEDEQNNWHRNTLETLPNIASKSSLRHSSAIRERDVQSPTPSSLYITGTTGQPLNSTPPTENSTAFNKAFPSSRDPINRGNSSVVLGGTISNLTQFSNANNNNNNNISTTTTTTTSTTTTYTNEEDTTTAADSPTLQRNNTISTSTSINSQLNALLNEQTSTTTNSTTTRPIMISNNSLNINRDHVNTSVVSEQHIFSVTNKTGISLSSNSMAIFSAADNPTHNTNQYQENPYDTESIISGYDRDDLSEYDSESEDKQQSIHRSQSAFSIHRSDRVLNRAESNLITSSKSNSSRQLNHHQHHSLKDEGKSNSSDRLQQQQQENIDPYEIQQRHTTSSPSNQRKKSSNTSSSTSSSSSSSESDSKLDDESDLNERFQKVVLRFREFPSLDTNLYRLQEICTDLLHISQDFIHTVKTYGRIIIEERYLKEKTIQSRSIGGHLGGDKYIVRNVLFKFSGSSNVYDEWGGAKVGGQELKGCMATLNCPIGGLCVPLMALVDFMGFRLIAMSYLPIISSGEKSTIVYGSSDMGKTVHANEKALPIMHSLSQMLNLKPHLGGTSVPPTLLYSATDIEGHIGTDGRFYLIDFSRTFPPTYPDENVPGGHLFQLFRPEFLKNHPKPLCSDAFSGFIKHDQDRLLHNQEVKEASNRLLTELIPRLSIRLKWMIKESLNNGTLLTGDVHIPEQFHRQGINMRWIGHMLVIMDDRDACFVLLIEAIARVLKNDLRRRLRSAMKKYNQPLSAPYIDLTTKFLNMVFGVSNLPDFDTNDFWNVTVKNELASKFYIINIPTVLTQHKQNNNGSSNSLGTNTSSENVLDTSIGGNGLSNSGNNYPTTPKDSGIRKSTQYPLAPASPTIQSTQTPQQQQAQAQAATQQNSSNWKLQDILYEKLEGNGYTPVIGRHLLFTRFRDMTHLKFRKKTIEKVADTQSNLWNHYQPFDTSDLKKIGVRVKHTDLVTNAEGTFFYAKAMTERSIGTAIHLLHKARKFFELALISNPNNKETLQLCAQAWCKILEFSASQGKNMSNVRFSMSDRVVVNTDRYFLRAIDADTKGPLILFFYANFLVRCERYEKAEDYFLRSLEADSNNYRCLTAYANFLIERGFPNESSLFLERAKQCKAILVGGLK